MLNTGSVGYSNVTCTLATSAAWVTLLGWSSTFGNCLPGEVNHNARFSLMLEVATNAPTGIQFPFNLSLQDADGNTAQLSFYLSCVPQLNYLEVSPRTNSPGGTVSFTAYFHHYGNVPDDNGLAAVRVMARGQDGSQPVAVNLARVTGSTGVFAGAWTVPSETDWQTSVEVFDAFGKTGNYENIISGGFSTRPYNPQCHVLLYSDYQVRQMYSPPITQACLMEAITNAGYACYWWDAYYRGMISDSELSHKPILLYYPAGGGSDLPYDTQDRRALIRHLGNGGQVALLGSTIAYSIYNSGDTTSRFLLGNAFGCAWVTNFGGSLSKMGFTNVLGQAGDPIGSGLAFSADITFDGQDEIQAFGNGTACFAYDTNAAANGARPVALGTAGVRTSNTVFLAWFGSCIQFSSSMMNDLVRNILSYFNRSAPYVHGGTAADESIVMLASRVLTFHWGGFNAPQLDHYEVAIGTVSNGVDVLDWTPVSAATNLYRWNGTMRRGQSYYSSVRSVSASGVISGGPVCSAGLHAGLAVHAIAGDFDGDRQCDPALYLSAPAVLQAPPADPFVGGTWGVAMSAAHYATSMLTAFGGSNWLALPGDFDGDHKADPAIYHAGSGDWQVKGSAADYAVQSLSGLGGSGYIPVAGDYDADRKADPAVYQVTSGVWSVALSASGYAAARVSGFGGPAYLPVMGDFDGDAKADPALYDPDTGLWLFELSMFHYAVAAVVGFGGPGAVPLAGDFDGDARADPALYQPATGYWAAQLSSQNYAVSFQLGVRAADAEPLAADFDGDGQADLALYSPALGLWGVQLSSLHYILMTLSFGGGDALPVQ